MTRIYSEMKSVRFYIVALSFVAGGLCIGLLLTFVFMEKRIER